MISSVSLPEVTVLVAGDIFLLVYFFCLSADKPLHLSTLLHSSDVSLDFSSLIFSPAPSLPTCHPHFPSADLSSLHVTSTLPPPYPPLV